MNNRVKPQSTRTRTDQDGQYLRSDPKVHRPVPVIERKEEPTSEQLYDVAPVSMRTRHQGNTDERRAV